MEKKEQKILVGLRIPARMDKLLKKRADEIGISKTSYIMLLLYQALGEPKEKKEAER